MEISREGHSGLHTIHFSNVFPPPPKGSASANTTANSNVASSSGVPCSITQFSQWHVLITMSVEDEVCYVMRSEAKVFSPTASLASPAARGMNRDGEPVASVTVPDGIPIVPIHQKDRICHVSPEGSNRLDSAASGTGIFHLELHFQRLEGELLGLREPAELEDVVLSCGGDKACGWHMGTVSVKAGGVPVEMPQPLRFLLKPYYGKRCSYCLDPVYTIGCTCDECEVTQYCSRECVHAHIRKGHGLLCPLLKSKYRVKSGSVVTEVSDDTRIVAWWRCLENSYYSILVDSADALGFAVEFTLNTLKSARTEGLQYQFITPKGGDDAKEASASPPIPSQERIVEFSSALFREVNRHAVAEGYVPLAAACLDYLYVFSPSGEVTIQAHDLFYMSFRCEELERDGYPITTVEEFVSFSRTLHSLAALHLEYALKSPIAAEFWSRMKRAKSVLWTLVNLSTGSPCPEVEGMRQVVVDQQCQNYLMLSKVFLIMATRSPEADAINWLSHAEKWMRQCNDCEYIKVNRYAHGIANFRMAALLLLYPNDQAKAEEARQYRLKGEELLRGCGNRGGGLRGSVDEQQSGVEMEEVAAVPAKTA